MKDMMGARFGRLTVVGFSHLSDRREAHWHTACNCGGSRVIPGSELRRGKSRHCGCERKPKPRKPRKKRDRGKAPPLYQTWRHMIARCHYPTDKSYARYGGRGIKVCDRWRESFEAFVQDVGPRPSPEHSIDRYPNTMGNYEPGNVRWATQIEQQRNRTNNRIVTFGDFSGTAAALAEHLGLPKKIVQDRLRRGYPPERAVAEARLHK